MKLLFFTLIFFFYSSTKNIYSQPTIVAGSFEYIWEKSFPQMGKLIDRSIIIADDEFAKASIRNSFAKAFTGLCNFAFPNVSLSARPLGVFATVPKFHTNLKIINQENGVWF